MATTPAPPKHAFTYFPSSFHLILTLTPSFTTPLPSLPTPVKKLTLLLPPAGKGKLAHICKRTSYHRDPSAPKRPVPITFTPTLSPTHPPFGEHTRLALQYWGKHPLFAAAISAARFAALLAALPQLEELHVLAAGRRAAAPTFHTGIADLALASLRAAAEHAGAKLWKLVLTTHLRGAAVCRSGVPGVAAGPRVGCVWRFVRRLELRVHAWRRPEGGVDGAGCALLRDFLAQFVSVEAVRFSWDGRLGHRAEGEAGTGMESTGGGEESTDGAATTGGGEVDGKKKCSKKDEERPRGPWPFPPHAEYVWLHSLRVERIQAQAWMLEAFLLRHQELREIVAKESTVSDHWDGLEVTARPEGKTGVAVRLQGVQTPIDAAGRRRSTSSSVYSQDGTNLEQTQEILRLWESSEQSMP